MDKEAPEIESYEHLKNNNIAIKQATKYGAAPRNAHGSIPHDQQGILLSAIPSYLSVKGKPLTDQDGIEFNDANTIVQPGDSFEVQLDPNNNSIFTIYAHMDPTKHFVTDNDGKYVNKQGIVIENYYYLDEEYTSIISLDDNKQYNYNEQNEK